MKTTAGVKRLYVSAAHRRLDRTFVVPMEVPFGTSHVREVGSSHTACGLPALNWPIFWDTEYDEVDDICRECRWHARMESLERRSGTAATTRGG